MTDILNALVLFANFVFVPGLAYGSQLALGALGVTLIYAVLRFSNFAHGDLMAFGAMCVILVTWWFQSMGISAGVFPTALLALPFGILGAVALSLIFDRTVYRFYRAQRAPPVVFVIASVGVMFMINGLTRLIIGPDDQRFADGARFIIRAPEFKEMTGLAEGLALRSTQAITVLVAIAVMIALFWFLNRSRMGKAMRAYADNEDLALLSGINPDRVVLYTWIIAAALATIAGTLYGLDKSFKPFTYFQLLLPIFAAAIVGGIGNPLGAIAGGFVIAFSEVTVTYAYRKFVDYLVPGWEPDGLLQLLSTDYKFAVSFVILVVVLLIRPTGLFRGKVI
ncbi:branched-chain amino acid ABC transporter permease [Algicella marina]|uniref:Branched-chain amino acid ABC transporter permease n=1 Tax=Algicella marina TaxID=2683284 RepID=A0A6P1SZI0_9RHOB|nr:branched-chain amino acid ABC transporter permease [Algicella marina]QHQ35888.1 branched-chain amino acid ABC transporter permease [Algicella marina]